MNRKLISMVLASVCGIGMGFGTQPVSASDLSRFLERSRVTVVASNGPAYPGQYNGYGYGYGNGPQYFPQYGNQNGGYPPIPQNAWPLVSHGYQPAPYGDGCGYGGVGPRSNGYGYGPGRYDHGYRNSHHYGYR